MATSKKVILDSGNAKPITYEQFTTWSTGAGNATSTGLNSGSYNPAAGGNVINVQSSTEPEQIIDPNTTDNSPQPSLPVINSQQENTAPAPLTEQEAAAYRTFANTPSNPQDQNAVQGTYYQTADSLAITEADINNNPSQVRATLAGLNEDLTLQVTEPTPTNVTIPDDNPSVPSQTPFPTTGFTGTTIPDALANETIYYSNGIVEKVQYFGTPENTNEDPFEVARLEAEANLNSNPEGYDLELIRNQDPYEAARLEAEAQFNEPAETYGLQAEEDPYEAARLEAEANYNAEPELYGLQAEEDPYEASRLAAEERYNTDPYEFDAESADGSDLQGAIVNAQQQQAISTQSGANQNSDWRVRLRLAPAANYLYNAEQPGILAPLSTRGGTDGVIFPYTPKIDTGYKAQYNPLDLTHSNYRGYFYQNSYVDAVNITGHFTAQNTTDARYLLAVIHFFRSVTKMFYGNDPQRGSPPPLVFLSGYGTYQFNGLPAVVSSFTYSLPDDVDYIKADVANQQGQNTTSRQPKSNGDAFFSPAGGRLATSNLTQGAVPSTPFGTNGQVNLATGAPTMVPTKMDIQITLLPMVSRTNVSKQFSLAQYASGNGLKGGFW